MKYGSIFLSIMLFCAQLVSAQLVSAQVARPPMGSGGGSGYVSVLDEGTPLTARMKLNFIGAAVSCADNAGSTRTDCTFTGGPSVGAANVLQMSDGFGSFLAANAGTFSTSLTGPLLVGGTAVSSTLTLQSTSGVGSSDAIKFLVGNNGATEAGRYTTTGNLQLSGMLTSGTAIAAVPTLTISAQPSAGDYTNVRAEKTIITGASSAGTPASGYLYTTEVIPHYVQFTSAAGHNQSTSTNDGRTGQAVYRTKVIGTGQGDYVAYNFDVAISGQRSGATHFLANPAAVGLNGEVFATAAGQYLNPVEIVLTDNGHDVAGIGHVLRMGRTANTGALDAVWVGFRAQTSGATQAVDAGYTLAGNSVAWRRGLDFTPALFDTDQAAIVLPANARMYYQGVATADSSGAKWFASSVGNYYTGYDGTTFNTLLTSLTNTTAGAATNRGHYVRGYDQHASGTNTNFNVVDLEGNYNTANTTTSFNTLKVQAYNLAAGTVTTQSAIRVGNNANSGGGVITNAAGLFVEDQTSGTNKWAITTTQSTGLAFFAQGAARSAFLGGIGVGAGTSGSSKDFSFGGTAPRTMGLERNTTAATAGQAWTLNGGGAVSGGTNLAGGAITMAAGIGTGNAVPALLRFQGDAASATSGTSDHSTIDRLIPNGFKVLTDGSPINLVNFTVASGSSAGAVIDYVVEVLDTTGTPNAQVETGRVYVSSQNTGGTISSTATEVNSQQNLGSGTMTTTWAITNANPAVLSLNADTSLTAATGYPRITYSITNLGQQAVALQ